MNNNAKDVYKRAKAAYRKTKTEEIRYQKFFHDLDQILQDNVDCMIDEDGNPIPHDITEDAVYGLIMQKDEYHLLGQENVKEMIHLFMTNNNVRFAFLHAFDLM